MGCDVFKGSDYKLFGQMETAFATAPTPDANRIKFSQISLNRNPLRQQDPTIVDTVLMEKTDEVDESPEGSITAIACLNDALFWMTLLFGAPDSTGAGPFVHTFTLDKDCKPSALLELFGTDPDGTGVRIRRYLGMMVKDFSWDILNADQNWTANFLMARAVQPYPTVAFDTTPQDVYVKARAMAAKGDIYDVDGSSTLGKISGATLNVNLDPQPQKLADGLVGYGDVLPGQIEISGTISALFRNGDIADAADSHTTKKLVIETASKAGTETLVITIPSVEFSEPTMEIQTRQGIVRTYNWRAHHLDGDDPIEIVLTNAVESLLTPAP